MMKLNLRIEGVAVLAAATAAYFARGGSGWLFAALLLAPDVAMLGYLLGKRAGSVSYNLAHHYAAPLALLSVGWLAALPLATHLGLLWAAHIGMDRALGYGFKYASGFKDTHLARV